MSARFVDVDRDTPLLFPVDLMEKPGGYLVFPRANDSSRGF
jgi:hypothetical protein